MSLRQDIVQRDECLDIRSIDPKIKVKNPWRWEWLEEKAEPDGKEYLSRCIRKIKTAGKAYCIQCQVEINYEQRGLVALKDHVKSKKHAKLTEIARTNYRLPGKPY